MKQEVHDKKPYVMTCHWGHLENRRKARSGFDTRAEARGAWDNAIQSARRDKELLRIKLKTPWGTSRHTERADRDNFHTDTQPRMPWYTLPAAVILVIFTTMAVTGSFRYHS